MPPNTFKSSHELVNDDDLGLSDRLDALDNIDNDNVLLDIVRDSSSITIKREACSKIKNQRILKYLAANHPESLIRSVASQNISECHVQANK